MRPMLRDGLIDFAIVLAVGTAPGICCPRSTKPIARFTHQARRHHGSVANAAPIGAMSARLRVLVVQLVARSRRRRRHVGINKSAGMNPSLATIS